MITTTTTTSGTTHRLTKRRLAAAAATVALVATGAVTAAGGLTSADDEGGGGSPAPPGQDVTIEDFELGTDELIKTSGSTFDETILTKHIPAAAFEVQQGDGNDADVQSTESDTCRAASSSSAGTLTELYAPVELPDGARIKQVIFYGGDNDAANIQVRLLRREYRTTFVFPGPPSVSRTQTLVTTFTTSGASGDAVVVSSDDDLAELVNSPAGDGPFVDLGFPNRFHTLYVQMTNSAGVNHTLCGAVVQYQVPVAADPGTVFHPLEPFRAFDSRQASFGPLSGRLTPNSSKVIDITDGYDNSGVAIPAQENLVPTTATAIAYNITVAGQTGPNFVAVTPGDATSFTASAVNYTGTGSIANGSTVTVAADQTIKVWGGDNTGSAHITIDVVGYYAEGVPSNMAN